MRWIPALENAHRAIDALRVREHAQREPQTIIQYPTGEEAMDQTRLNALAAAIQAKGADKPCARCGHTTFSIVDETMLSIQPLSGNFVVGGSSVPALMVACNNCGNLWHHALVTLDMLPASLKKEGS
jgi:hypothetical protein